MSKIATLATILLMALLALAEATTYTTITATTIDEEAANPRGSGSQSCQEQQMTMSHCRMYLECQCQQGGSRGRSYESLRMVVNPQAGQQCEEQHLKQCCNQLGNIQEECRCQAIKMMVMQMEQTAGTEQMRGMRQMAQDLPNRCNMGPQQCQMRAVWF